MKLKTLVLPHLLFLSACSQLEPHPDWVQAPSEAELAYLAGLAQVAR